MNVPELIEKAKTHGHAMLITVGRLDRRAVIEALLVDVGPGASVDLVSWTIGIEDCLWLERMVNGGRIGRLRIIADVSTRAKTPERYDPLARIGQVIDIGDVHAKASIIESADGSIAFAEITSANLNKNRRAESWTLSTDPGVIADLRASIDRLRVTTFEPEPATTPLPFPKINTRSTSTGLVEICREEREGWLALLEGQLDAPGLVEIRLMHLEEWHVQRGAGRRLEGVFAKAWGVTPRTVRRDMARIRARMAVHGRRLVADHDAERFRMVQALEQLCQDANESGNLKVALECRKQQARMLGLEQPVRIEHSGPKGNPMTLNVDGLMDQLAKRLEDEK